MRLLVTGGCGFIGSHFVHLALANGCEVVTLDKLTYAGVRANLAEVDGHPGHELIVGDIADRQHVDSALRGGADAIVNFAAESHVDRSIIQPSDAVRTDVLGAATLLEAAVAHGIDRFVQVSTDEVYGPIPEGEAREDDALDPSSPYSASKAAADLLATAWRRTYDLDVRLTRGANTYGPRQHPEKLIPRFITNALDGLTLPVFGDGQQQRDWLFVDDHCAAVWTVLTAEEASGAYNVGGAFEATNLEVTQAILALTDADPSLISHVEDRPGHDRRYSVDDRRLRALGWAAATTFDEGLAATVDWYRSSRAW